jgi:hypothetical protein
MTFHQRKIITNIEQPGAAVQGGAALFFRMQIAGGLRSNTTLAGPGGG